MPFTVTVPKGTYPTTELGRHQEWNNIGDGQKASEAVYVQSLICSNEPDILNGISTFLPVSGCIIAYRITDKNITMFNKCNWGLIKPLHCLTD